MSNSDYSFKVLKGLHEGVTTPIKSKRLVVGSSDECDIILSDLKPYKKYIEFVFQGDEIFVKGYQLGIFVDDIELKIPSKYLPYKPYQLIDFDVCSISVGNLDGEWPSATNHSSATKNQSFYNKPAFIMKSKNSNKKIIASITALLVVIGSIFLLNKLDSDNETIMPLMSVSKSVNKDAREEIKLEASKILIAYDESNVGLSLNNKGILTATGFIRNSENWAHAKSSIIQDISVVSVINDDQLKTPEEILATINEMIETNGLKEKIRISNDNGIFISTGTILRSDSKKWIQLKEKFFAIYDSRALLEDTVSISKLKLSIQSVNIGKSRYFISSDGIKYMAGSDLGNGYKVNSIEIDKIVLINKGNIVPIYYSN